MCGPEEEYEGGSGLKNTTTTPARGGLPTLKEKREREKAGRFLVLLLASTTTRTRSLLLIVLTIMP